MTHVPVFFLPRPSSRHLFNLVVVLPDNMLAQMGLRPSDSGDDVWVMHLTRFVVVANHEEALMIFDAMHTEAAQQQGGWNQARTAEWQSDRVRFESVLQQTTFPEVMTAPSAPFLVRRTLLVSPELHGLSLNMGQEISNIETDAHSTPSNNQHDLNLNEDKPGE